MLTTAPPTKGRSQAAKTLDPLPKVVLSVALLALICAAFIAFAIATLQLPTFSLSAMPNAGDDMRQAAGASTATPDSPRLISASVTRVVDGEHDAHRNNPGEPFAAPVPLSVGPDDELRVALWGDSLAFEAEEYFVGAFENVDAATTIDTYVLGGTAICDFIDHMDTQVASNDYDAVVVAFSGNALTPCMQAPNGATFAGPAHTAAYTLDLQAAISRAHGTPLFLAIAPQSETDSDEAEALRTMYRRRAAEIRSVYVVETGEALLANGSWTATLPCLPFEDESYGCSDGNIVVRAPDGAHFCPGSGPAVEGVTGSCERWSSGAYRFGQALAQPILDGLQESAVA